MTSTVNTELSSIASRLIQAAPSQKAINREAGRALVAHLKKVSKTNLKKMRQPHSFKPIPDSHYMDLMPLGRGRYRAIVVSTVMSLLWDGWKSGKNTRRKPNNNVMLTRRMLSQHFNMCPSTVQEAINDLVKHDKIIVAQKHVYLGLKGKNLGTSYRLPWMEKPKGKCLNIYWGLLVSEPFLHASVVLQAVIILLHRLHNRKKNRLTIRPCALEQYGIHRNRLPEYIIQLTNIGLLEYVEDFDYEFTWFDPDGKPEFTRLKLNPMHLTQSDPAPNSVQGAANG
jgi:hypothetical protein